MRTRRCLSAAAAWLLASAALSAAIMQSEPVRLDPFAASRLQIDPPTFRWPEAAGATAYRIQLARAPDFAAPREAVVSELFYRPQDPLASGRWYWRCRAEAPRPGPWMAAETFVIADALPREPIPPWSELMARIPSSHPRIFLRGQDIARVRANARRQAARFEVWKAKVRRELEQPFSIETYAAQVPPGADPDRRDSPALKKLIWASRTAGQAAAYPPADGAWVWLVTGDRWFLDAALRRARVEADLDPNGLISERNSGNDSGNLEFGNAAIVASLGEVYDLLYAQLTPADRRRIRAAILARDAPIFAKLARAPLNLMRGHGWQHAFVEGLSGAGAICDEEPAARRWVELGLKSFVALYPWFGGRDGGTQEGPRYFHAEEMQGALEAIDFFRSMFGLKLEDIQPWFRQSPWFLIYSYPPNSLMAKVCDVDRGYPIEPDDRLTPGGKARLGALRMAELYGNGFAAAYAAELPRGTAGITLSQWLRWSDPPSVAPRPLAELPPARAFLDVGTVFTHSHYTRPEDNVRLTFHSSPYGGFDHAHADQNGFTLIAYNEDLLLNSGYYTPFGDPHRQKWYVQTQAHNTILVDGRGQPYGNTDGYGEVTHFEQHPGWVYMVGRAATAYPRGLLDRYDRHIVWLRGGPAEIYVIVDDIAAGGGKARRIDWLLHAARRMDIDPAAQTVRVRGAKGEALVRFLAPASLAFHQDDRYAAPATYWREGRNFPLPNEWHLKATATAAPRLRFVTVIEVSKPGVPKPSARALPGGVETGGWRVRWSGDPLRLSVEPAAGGPSP